MGEIQTAECDPGYLKPEIEDKPREECGVVAIYSHSKLRVELTLDAMAALQGRGQAAAGMAVFDAGESDPTVQKELGVLSEAITPRMQQLLKYSSTTPVTLGHLRYMTSGKPNGDGFDLAQPLYRDGIALGQNGHEEYMHEIAEYFGIDTTPESSDSQLLINTIAEIKSRRGCDLIEALQIVMQRVTGAATLVLAEKDRIIGARDLHGYRPLSIGRLPYGGMAFVSETAALDLINAEFIREVEPGEIVSYDGKELRSEKIPGVPDERLCLFEFIYFAHPNSMMKGRNIYEMREQLGRKLAANHPVDADIVVGVQKSGIPYAAGYAHQLSIPDVPALTKNEYAGRTFIDAIATIEKKVKRKHWPNKAIMAGKDLVLVDDSIVRGNTMKEIIKLCRNAGAGKVHVRVPSSPYAWPCFFGMNTRDTSDLIAFNNSVEEIRQEIGADSLEFLTIEEIAEVFDTHPKGKRDRQKQLLGGFCTACMTGMYHSPVPLDLVIKPGMSEIE